MGDTNNGKSLKDQFVDAVISSGGPMGYWEAKLDRIARNTGWAMPDEWQRASLTSSLSGASTDIASAQSFVSSINGQTAQKASDRANRVKAKGDEFVDGTNEALTGMAGVVEAANKVITDLRDRQNELPGNRLSGVAEAAVRGAQVGAMVTMPAVSLTVSILTGWADPVAEINKKLEANREEQAKRIYQETVEAFNHVQTTPPPDVMQDPDPIIDDGTVIHEPIEDVTDTGGTGSYTGVSGVGGVPNSVNIGGGATGSGSGVRPMGTPLGNGAYDINGDGIADYYDYNGDGIPDRWVNGGGSGADGAQTPGSSSGTGANGSYPPAGSDDGRVNYPGTPATPGYPSYPDRPDYPDYPGRPGQTGTIPGTPGANYPSVPPAPGYPGQPGYPGGAAYPSGTVYPSGAAYPGWSSTSVDSGMSGGGLSSLPGAGVAGSGTGLSGVGVGSHGGFGAGAGLGAGLGAGATAGGLGTLAAVGGNGSFFTNAPVGATVTNPAGMTGATGLAKGLKTGAAGAATAGAGAAGRGGMMGAPGAAGTGDKGRKRQGLGLMAPKLDDDDDVALRSAGMMAGHRVKKA